MTALSGPTPSPDAELWLVALAGATSLALIAFATRLVVARRRAPRLPPPLAEPPLVQILLPVRDEEANVAAVLAALAAQTAPVAIRVLDDGSTDATAAIAARSAAADPRIELLRVPPPAAGASGKVNALAFGSQGVEAEWIAAIDADARPAPDALSRSLAAAQSERLDAVSLAARQTVETPGEALLTPLAFALLDALLGDWRAVARGEGPPVANGQFFLVRRTALETIGGYGSIAGEPLDDVALARRLAGAGFRVGFWRAGRALEVRMYRGFRDTFRGWRRNLALIVGERRGVALAAALLPLLPAALALGALAAGAPEIALVTWAGGTVASLVARSGTGSSSLWGALYPLDASMLSACLLAALGDRARGRLSPWRGRRLDPS